MTYTILSTAALDCRSIIGCPEGDATTESSVKADTEKINCENIMSRNRVDIEETARVLKSEYSGRSLLNLQPVSETRLGPRTRTEQQDHGGSI